MLVGNVTYDEDSRALGGINCQCVDEVECTEAQGKVMHWLEVPDYLPVFQAKCGQSKGKGRGKYEAGKGKSRRVFSSSSPSV